MFPTPIWMKSEHSCMNFIHDGVDDDARHDAKAIMHDN
jgi:hypothetical protein